MRQILKHMPNGGVIEQITLNNGTLRAQILSLGGVIQWLGWAGTDQNLVLGYPTVDPYLKNPGKLGALVGRYANRIAGAQAVIGGKTYHFDANVRDTHTLHGGRDTMAFHLMQVVDSTPTSVQLRDVIPDGHMGFPGTLTVDVTYTLDGSVLRTTIAATTDAPTLCNITGHSYFNLSGDHDISDHTLQVHADQVLEVDADSIPTGGYIDVASTPFDLRSPTPLGVDGMVRDLDHNYCLSHDQTPLRPVAHLQAGECRMTLATTEAGLQVYTGGHLGATLENAPNGTAFHPFAGVALEPQFYPNSPNQPAFAQALLSPGETYRHITEYRFQRGAS